ncbi:MAG: signal peptidase I [Clostridiales bacterium]|jgi:signal peptidase|nr:signal peptidase I [Clostridiales bacterium]
MEATNDGNKNLGSSAKKAGKAMKIIGNGLFGLVILLVIVMVFSVIQNKVSGGPPRIAGYHMYIVLSGSMAPAFDAGSMVFVKPVEPEEIKEGDIITYRGLGDSSFLTTHRVVEIIGSGKDLEFVTKGDANDVNDPNPVPGENLVGRVALAVPYMGYLMDFGQTKRGMLVLIVVPGVLLIINESYKLYKNVSKVNEHENKSTAAKQVAGKDEA